MGTARVESGAEGQAQHGGYKKYYEYACVEPRCGDVIREVLLLEGDKDPTEEKRPGRMRVNVHWMSTMR